MYLVSDHEYKAFPKLFAVRNTLHKSDKRIDTLTFHLIQNRSQPKVISTSIFLMVKRRTLNEEPNQTQEQRSNLMFCN